MSPSFLAQTLSTSCCFGRHTHQLCFCVLISSGVSSQGKTENKRAAAAKSFIIDLYYDKKNTLFCCLYFFLICLFSFQQGRSLLFSFLTSTAHIKIPWGLHLISDIIWALQHFDQVFLSVVKLYNAPPKRVFHCADCQKPKPKKMCPTCLICTWLKINIEIIKGPIEFWLNQIVSQNMKCWYECCLPVSYTECSVAF